MSRSSERKARKLTNQYNAALVRFANGKATPRDIDMLDRMRREANGKNGYTGESRSSGTNVNHTGPIGKPNGSANAFPTFRVTQPRDEHVFVCAESKELTEKCPLNPKVPYILVPVAMWQTFLRLAKDINTEWIALLKGKLTTDDKNEPVYLIESYYHPPQTAGSAHVDIPTGVTPKPGTIGAIHSHVGMQVFFSGTDIAHSNWPVEIVINNRNEYEAVARLQLKCGEYAKYKATVYVDGQMPKSKATEALETAFQQGRMLEEGKVKPHSPSLSVSTPSQGGSQTATQGDTDKQTTSMMTTGLTGEGSKANSPADNPNNPRMCNCGHTFGDHYRTDVQKEQFPQGIMAGMCLDEACKCERFDEKMELCKCGHSSITHGPNGCYRSDCSCKQLDIPKQLSFPVGEGIITTNVSDTPDEALSEETCEVCEGDKYVTEEHTEGVKKITKTRICPACNGDGLSQLGKVRLAEMADSMKNGG